MVYRCIYSIPICCPLPNYAKPARNLIQATTNQAFEGDAIERSRQWIKSVEHDRCLYAFEHF